MGRRPSFFLLSKVPSFVLWLQCRLHTWHLPFRLCPMLVLWRSPDPTKGKSGRAPAPALEFLAQLRTGAAEEAEGTAYSSHCRVHCNPRTNFKGWGTIAAARGGVSFRRSCAASDLGSFPSVERTKLMKMFPGKDPEQLVS